MHLSDNPVDSNKVHQPGEKDSGKGRGRGKGYPDLDVVGSSRENVLLYFFEGSCSLDSSRAL